MRYLSIDWGTVRLGVAISDPDGRIAFPLDRFIEAKNGIQELKALIQEKEVGRVLIGLPKGLAGQDTASTEQAKKFIADLQEQIAAPIEVLDERFSSVAASKHLTGQGLSQKQQRDLKDNLSAQMILETYLETKK